LHPVVPACDLFLGASAAWRLTLPLPRGTLVGTWFHPWLNSLAPAGDMVMRRIPAIVLCLASVWVGQSVALEASDSLKSGPQVGEMIPGSFHFLNINGAFAGDPHCLVCEYGLRPVVAVFARRVPKEKDALLTLLGKVDDTVANRQAAELRGFAAFLNADYANEDSRKALVGDLENIAKEWKKVILCVGDDKGPEKYNINKDAEVTVVLYNKHQVVANFAFAKEKLTDKDVNEIVAAIEKIAPKK
jgi:hypothetical protein